MIGNDDNNDNEKCINCVLILLSKPLNHNSNGDERSDDEIILIILLTLLASNNNINNVRYNINNVRVVVLILSNRADRQGRKKRFLKTGESALSGKDDRKNNENRIDDNK